MHTQESIEAFFMLGTEPAQLPVEQLGSFLHSESARREKFIKETNMHID
jgi:hypothetical protein